MEENLIRSIGSFIFKIKYLIRNNPFSPFLQENSQKITTECW